eukprot:g66130.t1
MVSGGDTSMNDDEDKKEEISVSVSSHIFDSFIMSVLVLIFTGAVQACTNFLVTRGASANNSTMISYNADSEALYGCIYHTAAGKWPEGSTIDIYDWDSTKYLGTIPQAAVTYNVYGNTNQNQVAITETTFGGLPQLQQQQGAIMDYGSLIYVTLARATSARHAIQIMGDLVSTYGYASSGESFSIADTQEVWILEMIGKGKYEKGAVWVALQIPDGYVSGHANQARIRTFPQNDPTRSLFAADVISFARKLGLYAGSDADFSFSDVYNPVTFEGARFCEARVWAMFNKMTALGPRYLSYAQGYDLTNRMPLWVQPNAKVTLADIQSWMGDHYEGTWLDFSTDAGAGAFDASYRWRPLTWTSGDFTYLNERAAGTQQTGFSMVAQLRGNMPNVLGTLLWFAPDDGATAVYVPFYSSATKVPESYSCQWKGSGPNGDILAFDMNRAFWIFNVVANYAYARWNLLQPEIQQQQASHREKFSSLVAQIDQAAMAMRAQGKSDSVVADYLTDSNQQLAQLMIQDCNQQLAQLMIQDWNKFFGSLFTKYKDGYVITRSVDSNSYLPQINNPGYSDAWRTRIVQEAGSKYLVPPTATYTTLHTGEAVSSKPLDEARSNSKSFL